jgi:putative LysE/RhtB family amino acid efflux pump
MMLIVFCKGLLIGLLVALPVGPAGALAVKRALINGPRAGFLCGLGSTVSDAFYLTLLQAGFSAITFSPQQNSLMRAIGGTIVLAVGMDMLLRKVATDDRAPKQRRGAFLSAFLLSISNPTILLTFALLFSSFELSEASRNHSAAVLLNVGVFCGSVLLWLLLSRFLQSVQRMPSARRLAGAIFVSVGIAILLLSVASFNQPA